MLDTILSVAQIVPITEAEGPGLRFALWFQGCPLRCPGCCNPEMLPFSGGTPTGRAGRLKSIADAAGNLTEVTSWDGSGRPTEVQRVSGTGGSALTESFLTAYVAGGANAGLVETVTQRTKVGTGSWSKQEQ